MMKIKNIEDVVNNHLCTGCGACAYLAAESIEMIDDINVGRRPLISPEKKSKSFDALKFCPGWNIDRNDIKHDDLNSIQNLRMQWGNIYEVWEVYAVDDEVRKRGSSGGVITALSLYCLEQEKMSGVLNTHASLSNPITNDTSMSMNREQLLASSGSRYAPSSPCEKLGDIESSSGPCVFVGKPCDAAAVHKIRKESKKLGEKLGLVVTFFCAGVPSTLGVKKLITSVGVTEDKKIEKLRFRGDGWPGLWVLKYWAGSKLKAKQLTYQESWGFLQSYRQWRCYICPDHTGEFSDLSVGDPWYKEIKDNDMGKSLVIVRTEVGKRILHAAAEAGYVILEKSDPSMLPKSQPNLITAKAVLWGRLFALKIVGAAVPQYKGFNLFNFWLKDLKLKQKLSSILGTVKRIFLKKLNVKYVINDGK